MWEKIIKRSFLIIVCLVSSLASGAADPHVEELKSKFPYGLLGGDHGILNLDDLAMNVCRVVPKPFEPDSRYYPYEYWQCFESKTISFDCDSSGIPDKHEGVMGLIVVKASISGVQHEYLEGRLWPIKECKRFLRDAAALLKGDQHVCISGSFNKNELDPSVPPLTSWMFDRIKTKNGCEGHHCDFTQKFKQENCPDLKL